MSTTHRGGDLHRRLDAVEAKARARQQRTPRWIEAEAALDRKLVEWAAQIAADYPDGLPPLDEEARHEGEIALQRLWVECRVAAANAYAT